MVYICYIFLIHSSVKGHLGCFHVFAIVNRAAVSIERLEYFILFILFYLLFRAAPMHMEVPRLGVESEL